MLKSLTLAFVALGLSGVHTWAQSDNVYADRTITIVCWSAAGSLYDVNALTKKTLQDKPHSEADSVNMRLISVLNSG